MTSPMEGGGCVGAPMKSKNRRKGGPFKASHNRGKRRAPPIRTRSRGGTGTPLRFWPVLSNRAPFGMYSPCFESIPIWGPDALGVRKWKRV